MSLLPCDRCRLQIDTDEEPETYCEHNDQWICHLCREKEASRWKNEYDAAPLSERDPKRYREEMIDAGRGHLLGGES